ncbi:hypothetical protein BDF14DRAFT_1929755 [Spinellus fusiger]|nr:hypothetical protein BDF14DRAFT_1929755 [Spinellus fusiger]
MGGVTTNFKLLGVDSLSASIYLDKKLIEKAKSLAENINATSVSNTNIINQLQQISTKFDKPSSYYLCQASGPITKSYKYYSYSIYTLYNFNHGRNPGLKIFANTGISVLKNKDQAVLKRLWWMNVYQVLLGKQKAF